MATSHALHLPASSSRPLSLKKFNIYSIQVANSYGGQGQTYLLYHLP